MGKLEGKLAVITGGSSGIGLSTAKVFSKEGAYVFITGRRRTELDEAVRAIGHNVTAVQGDVTNLSDLDQLYEQVKKRGQIDILYANAGTLESAPIGEVTEQHFDRLFDLNVRGLLFTVQKALPLMKDGASVILAGSVAGSKGTPGNGVYGATKAAVRSFARSWTTEVKDRKIRVNVLSPGPVSTPATDKLSKEARAQYATTIPMGRFGEPEEIAKAALFLASDDASFITGIELFADGGRAQV